ncbi:MAG: AraC family transcriptional regulator [Variovorax sp.]|nr:MAG: AraC family transcriptional regulator [Variovorax sp.]
MADSTLMTTDVVAPRDRAPQWCEWVSSHFGGLQSDLYGDADFDGQLKSTHAGDVILTRLEADRHRVLRTPGMVRTSDVAYLKIVAPWQGSATVQQQGREACARDGAWVIYDTTGAYEIANPERCDHLIVMVPKDGVAQRGHRVDGVMARRLGASGISRVALETMRNTYLELPHMSEAAAQGAGEGESIAAYIQRQRLQACIRDLQQAGPHARPITDIALSWGFGNPSHFSRVFRDHTGKSPTEFRAS